ncbi:MAG: response regulator [Comamonadaceae bacterium]|nr:response regulator [Comamonadaceae bacterium]
MTAEQLPPADQNAMPLADFPTMAGELQRQLDVPSEADMRILVVDDEADIANSLASLLRLELACTVEVACDGQSAWTRVVEHAPDVLILDVRMPGVGGLDVARRVLLRGELPLPLLIAMTGQEASDVVGDLTDSFRYTYAKPVDVADLVNVLRAHWRGEDDRAARSRFELSSLVSRTVAEATPMFRSAHVDLAFDYDGPFVVLDEDDPALHAGLFRLLCGIHDLIGSGSVLCHASVRTLPGNACRFVLQIPATGPPGPRTLEEVLLRLRLRLVETALPSGAGRSSGMRQARGRCQLTGGRVTLVSVPEEGVLIRYERQWRATQVVDLPQGGAAGRNAWIAGAGAVEGLVFARRLERLGWRVQEFRRRDGHVGRVPVGAGAVRAGPGVLVRLAGPCGASGAPGAVPRRPGVDPDRGRRLAGVGLAGRVGARGEPHVSPVSTAELVALTRRFVASDTENARLLDAASTMSMQLQDPARVLVVDDIEVNRIIASALLAQMGLRIDEAADGLDAVDHCRRVPPDVVLMDVNMPILGGLATTRHLRELQRLGRLPPFVIVAATANTDAETARLCREAGMDAVLTKPLVFDDLKRTLDRVIVRRGASCEDSIGCCGRSPGAVLRDWKSPNLLSTDTATG